MLVGYARISTEDQKLDLQTDALEKAGCKKIFTDIASGAKTDRPGLNEALKYLREGDTLVIWKLDRLGRSLKHLIDTVTLLEKQGMGLKSLQESIDTSNSYGKLIFNLFGSLAEFERELIRERTCAGLSSARARGNKGGRPRVMTEAQARQLVTLHADPKNSIKDICKTFNISEGTMYHYLKKFKHTA